MPAVHAVTATGERSALSASSSAATTRSAVATLAFRPISPIRHIAGASGPSPETRERHWGDQWHYPLARIAVTCRAHGLRPIDGPYGDFTDPEGYIAAARRSAVLGYEGKWALHPSQVGLANEVFTPAPRLVERTRRIVEAMRTAATEGKGAVSLDGRLIDAASIRMAKNLLAKLEQIEARQPLDVVKPAATA